MFFLIPYRSSFEVINTGDNPNKNKSPVIHVDTHLGLESWCVQHVYEHAHKIILSVATTSSSSNWIVPEQTDLHSSCNNHHNHHKPIPTLHTTNQNIIKYLNCAILINPDVATFWNYRRRLFQKNRLNISREFQFSAIVLTKKPKSNDAFFYRRWLYSFQSHESIDWNRELALCERCASKTLSNYHAWCHRQWVLQKAPELLIYELRFTEKFIRKHIGDYSGYHYRQIVLRKLIEFSHLELKPCLDEYTALAKFLSDIGIRDTIDSEALLATNLIRIIVPEVAVDNDWDNEDDKTEVKSFLYCLNVAAFDLQLIIELNEMYGYREAFEYHRKATLKLIVDACNEFRTGHWSSRDQPLTKIKKTSAAEETDRFITAIQRYEGDHGNDAHRRWCELFLGFRF